MIGRPVHLGVGNRDWTACGKQSELSTGDCRRVECLLCRRTRRWRTLKDAQGQKNGMMDPSAKD
jgi:hypothetical protein